MRKGHHFVALVGLLGLAAVIPAGCTDYIAEYYTPLTDPNLFDAGLPPECQGVPSGKNTIDTCGVFVQADALPGGDGTQARPLAKLADAVAQAESTGKRVYACAGAPFVEAVTIASGVEVYGGFECAKGWTWSKDARTALNGPADAIALTIEKSAGGAKVAGLAITAASPGDMKGGGSSIAVAVDDATVTIERCDVKASDAADGADGQTPSTPATKGADAAVPDPTTMNACINPAAVMGGAPGATMCDDGTTSGGAGGKGGITGTSNGDGQSGADGAPADMVKGKGGSGADATNDCNDGTKGKNGDPGGAGPGGSASGDMVSLTGIANTDATDGNPGTKAQGGGGGGGAKAGTFCQAGAQVVDGPGASGGGGGAGGCGGKGGGGGKAGGSSIGIVSLGTHLALTEVTVVVGKAGKGGQGAAGQSGGDPGMGAAGGAKSGIAPSVPGCKGGDGGLGGAGGPGGGGRGGHAFGIVYAKMPSVAPVLKTFTQGAPGDGGAAGNGAPASSNGTPGNAAACWDFATDAACK